MNTYSVNRPYATAGTINFALRMVIGWTYFSAFWRRVILVDKLDPELAGYIGEKFNHFLPNALGIKPLIEHLLINPKHLHYAMVSFTVMEAITGLFLIFGLFTRLMSISVIGLALGILLGSGWIGTTCLDEWQIGILGIAGGFALLLSGSGLYSVDSWLINRGYKFTHSRWFRNFASGDFQMSEKAFKRLTFFGGMAILALTLYTNQYFHGGLWGTLHNKSVKPIVEIESAFVEHDRLKFSVYRTEGADVYGSFLIGIEVTDSNGSTVLYLNGEALSILNKSLIQNKYVAKVRPGKHSLIIPLGAKATISIPLQKQLRQGDYLLTLIDISGATWKRSLSI